jgi:hypothetical protein
MITTLEQLKALCEATNHLPIADQPIEPYADEPTDHELRQHGRVVGWTSTQLLVGESPQELTIVDRCQVCDGLGVSFEDRFTPEGGHFTIDVSCPECGLSPEDLPCDE